MSNGDINCFLTTLLISLLASFVILTSTGCRATEQEVNRNTIVIIPVNTDVPSGGDLIETDSYELVDEFSEREIKTISPKLGLAPLSKSGRPEQFEFRLWTNLGALGDPKLLGVRSSGKENDAYYLDFDKKADTVKSRREHLPSPKSGWNKMLFELRSRLTTPKGLIRDPQFDLQRDEPLILLEVLDKGEYRRVFYGQGTSFPDGKRLMQVCDYLASEFDVNMNCNAGSTAPE